MRTLGPEFCSVCKQQWGLTYFGHSRVSPTAPLEARNPESPLFTAVGAPVTFTLSTRLANGAGVTNGYTWKLQGPGMPVPTTIATGVDTISGSFNAPGVWVMTAEVVADTNLIKPAKNGSNVDTAIWEVDVCDASLGQCCGNGHLEPGETCDDGNTLAGDCCSPTCANEAAGTACSDSNACTGTDLCGITPIGSTQRFDITTAPALPAEWLSAVAPVTDDKWRTTSEFSVSAPNSINAGTPASVTDKVLDRDAFVALPGAVLEFDNRYNLESTFDGAVLEIKIGGGAFTDIVSAGGSFVTGAYNSVISSSFSSPIAGRATWSGASAGFVHTKVNLPASATGQPVVVRFRVATDVSAAATAPNGQWIDNVKISGNASLCQAGGPVNCDDSNPCSADSCNPGSGCVHTSPTSPTGSPVLTESKAGGIDFQLAWGAIAGATGYDVVYGFLDTLRSSSGNFQVATGTCLANDFAGLSLVVSGDPSFGHGFWLLVRGENCGGSGTYDTGSARQVGLRDAEIAASGNDCP
jgi:cysteine-rich repeat protein